MRRATIWSGLALAVLAASVSIGLLLTGEGGQSASTPSANSGRPHPNGPTRQGRSTGDGTTGHLLPTHRLPPPGTLRGLNVSISSVPIVDTTRDVVRDGTVLAPDRALPTSVWTPSGTGPFPLVVFVHGYDVGPLTFERFCSNLASSGYVVAAPSFPLEDPQRGFGLDRADLPNEAADVSFVITALENGTLAKEIDPSETAVVGHSDGADVALMTSYEQGTTDARVRAVIADAPDPIAASVVPSGAPLLLVQGTADSVVPYRASQTVFGQVEAPTYYLSLVGADHLTPIVGATPWTPALDSAAVEFLDATVAARAPESGLVSQLGSLPLAQLQTARLG